MNIDLSTFIFDDEYRKFDVDCDFVFFVEKNIIDKYVLFDRFSKKFNFPSYFGNNWDAFSDIMNDLSWIKQRKIFIIHKDIPLINSKQFNVYLEIISDCANNWRITNEHELLIIFPVASKSIIMTNMNY